MINEKENKDEKSKEKIKGNIIIGNIGNLKIEKNNLKQRIANSFENEDENYSIHCGGEIKNEK